MLIMCIIYYSIHNNVSYLIGTHPEHLAVILAYALALRNKVLFAKESGKQKCVLLCVPNESIASRIASKQNMM